MLTKKTTDSTIERNYILRMKKLTEEYELTKAGKHPRYRFVTDFYKANNLTRQNFIKYYHRYSENRDEKSLLPQKRGAKYKTRRTIPFIEKQVISLRLTGANRYEICDILKERLGKFTPSPSTIYNICSRYNLGKLTNKEKEIKRKIVKQKIGEMAHIDCHYLPKGIVENTNERYYLVGVIDDYSRIAWCEVAKDIQSLSVMFSLMRCFQILKNRYSIEFKEVLTDNGPEFGGKSSSDKNIMTNPVRRLFYEMGMKHRKIKPYRPQTNGKIERFWRTIEEDLFEENLFNSYENLVDELQQYMLYYNEYRPHQGIGGMKPAEKAGFVTETEPKL